MNLIIRIYPLFNVRYCTFALKIKGFFVEYIGNTLSFFFRMQFYPITLICFIIVCTVALKILGGLLIYICW